MNNTNSKKEASILKRALLFFKKKKNVKKDLPVLLPNFKDARDEIAFHIGEVYNFTAEHVAVPRADIIAVEVNTPPKELTEILYKSPHSYYPVYRNTLDNLIGIFAARDFIKSVSVLEDFVLREHIRESMIVSPTTPIIDVLYKMRSRAQRMAIIVDEYGGVDSLITAEDIVEKVIGRIEESEEDIADDYIAPQPDGSYLASARLAIEDFEEKFGPVFSSSIKEEGIETLGGLVFYIAGYIPVRGEIIKHPTSGVEFQVMDCNARFIKTLAIRNIPQL